MRRAATIGLLFVLGAGLLALVIDGATRKSTQVQTVGVLPVLPVAPIARGQEACQAPIALAQPVERVRFNVGTRGRPGPPLEVTIRDQRTRAALGSGRVAPGWKDDGSAQNVAVGRIAGGHAVAVCVRNLGGVRAYVFGDVYRGQLGSGPRGVRPTSTTTAATVDGTRIQGDISMAFVSDKARSRLSLLPAMFDRASVFRPGIVGPWLYWLLLVAVVAGAPLGLCLALRSAESGDPEGR